MMMLEQKEETPPTVALHNNRNNKKRRRKRMSSLLLLLIGISIALLEFRQIYHAHKAAAATTTTSSSRGILSQSKQPLQSLRRGENDLIVDPFPYLAPPPPGRDDNNSTFSACLLVMDDNHFLIEWLAYHYTTLPLRYLVITVDPRSTTSPKIILDKWDSYMTIVRWNDKNFLPIKWQNRIMQEDDPIGLLQKHRERQKHFYPACFEYLKQAGRTWTAVIDIDEYIVAPNRNFMIDNTTTINQQQQQQSRSIPTTTLLQQINDNTPKYHDPNQSCITIPRLRIGNFEDDNTTTRKLTPTTDDFHDRDFLTYRYRYRAGIHDRKTNRNPKSILQLQRIANFSRQETDAHLPVRSVCPKRNLYILNANSPYVIHHYSGSIEQFQFRKDARQGTANREKIVGYSQIQHSIDTAATTWLTQFIKEIPGGIDTAKQLLDGVGNVNYTTDIVTQMMQEGLLV